MTINTQRLKLEEVQVEYDLRNRFSDLLISFSEANERKQWVQAEKLFTQLLDLYVEALPCVVHAKAVANLELDNRNRL